MNQLNVTTLNLSSSVLCVGLSRLFLPFNGSFPCWLSCRGRGGVKQMSPRFLLSWTELGAPGSSAVAGCGKPQDSLRIQQTHSRCVCCSVDGSQSVCAAAALEIKRGISFHPVSHAAFWSLKWIWCSSSVVQIVLTQEELQMANSFICLQSVTTDSVPILREESPEMTLDPLGLRGRPHGKKQSFFFLRLPRHRFKNICVHTDPLKTTENAVVHIPAYRWRLTFTKNEEEDTEHAQKAFALYTNRQ